MKNEKFRKAIDEWGKENEVEIKILDNPSFDNSVIGITPSGRLIYDYDKMVCEFMEDENCDEEIDAIEFIDYNTMRALPYFGDNAPIVITPIFSILERYGD